MYVHPLTQKLNQYVILCTYSNKHILKVEEDVEQCYGDINVKDSPHGVLKLFLNIWDLSFYVPLTRLRKVPWLNIERTTPAIYKPELLCLSLSYKTCQATKRATCLLTFEGR